MLETFQGTAHPEAGLLNEEEYDYTRAMEDRREDLYRQKLSDL